MERSGIKERFFGESGITSKVLLFLATALIISQLIFILARDFGAALTTAVFFIVSPVVLVAFYFYLRKIIIKPFSSINESVTKITAGQMGERVRYDGTDEIGELAKSINVMTESLDHKFAQLSNLCEISKESISDLSFQEVLNHILETAVQFQGAESGSIMLLNRRTNELEIAAAVNIDEEIVKSARVKYGEGISGKVAKDGKPMLLVNGETIGGNRDLKDAVSIPIQSKDSLIGVLNLNNKGAVGIVESDSFDIKDLDFLTTLANHAASVINNAQLYEQLQKNYVNIIQTLTAAIDAKDPTTKGHSARVAEYAVAIAKELGMSLESLRTIQSAAYLHDVGKIGIPEYILGKPGSLTDEEFEIIKTHPKISAKILAPVQFDEPIIPIVRHHHERYSGGGYPDNLRGENIPVEARIMALADSFDAMISSRPYRPAHSVDWAMEEIKNCAGKQFDPYIAEVFLQVIDAMFRPSPVLEPKPEPVLPAENRKELGKDQAADDKKIAVQ